jgi:hypothetical protein
LAFVVENVRAYPEMLGEFSAVHFPLFYVRFPTLYLALTLRLAEAGTGSVPPLPQPQSFLLIFLQ